MRSALVVKREIPLQPLAGFGYRVVSAGGRYDAEDQEYRGFGRALQVNPDQRIEGEGSGTSRPTRRDYTPDTGNLRFEDQYTGSGYARRSWSYDGYGNPISETDPNGNTFYYEYEDAAHAFLRRIERPPTNGVSHIEENLSFDYRVGKPTRSRDENGQVTSLGSAEVRIGYAQLICNDFELLNNLNIIRQYPRAFYL